MTVANLMMAIADAGLTVRVVGETLVFKPAGKLTGELRARVVVHKADLVDWLTASNDPAPDLTGWNVTGLKDAAPATVAKFRGASVALDRHVAAAGEVEPDSDQDCWPHSSAMNASEIEQMVSRVDLFTHRGLSPERAEALADKLVLLDREDDERRTCLQCGHFINGRRCAVWRRAGIGGPAIGELVLKLQRCPAYQGLIQQEGNTE